MLINVAQSEECRIAIVEDGVLEELYIELNQFTGPISREKWTFLGQFSDIYIYENRFTGRLPDDIGEILSGDTLSFSVSENLFSGTIPASMGLLSQLEWFSVRNNAFTGTIPSNLTAGSISLEGNSFGGSVPRSLCAAVYASGGEIVYDCDGSLSCSKCESFCTCAAGTL